jgi:hypothetical protein
MASKKDKEREDRIENEAISPLKKGDEVEVSGTANPSFSRRIITNISCWHSGGR